MQVNFGFCATAYKLGEKKLITWDSKKAVNGHILMVGMTGAGKTFQLRKIVRDMLKSERGAGLRVHVFDVHGDITLDGESSVLFSEQTPWGLNPLRVSHDLHFGGVRKKIQGFINTINKVMHPIGARQEAVLRNILLDLYLQHGFKSDEPSTWFLGESGERLLTDGSDARLYIDVPEWEEDQLSDLDIGASWDENLECWWLVPQAYTGSVTRWPPKTMSRTHPTLADALRLARHVHQMCFLGTGMEAIRDLETVNRNASALQKKLFQTLKHGGPAVIDTALKEALQKSKTKALESYRGFLESLITGRELKDVMKYESQDVLRSVIDRLDNILAIGIFKDRPAPFDESSPVWRYNIKPLRLEERKLFVLFRLEEIFYQAVQKGEQSEITDVIVLDEAHIYADDDPDNIINTIAKEARKFGIALICASQSPTHFTEDFLSSVATKIILGIDETFWRGSIAKMRVTEDSLKWITTQQSMLVQMKTKGDTRSDWRRVRIDGQATSVSREDDVLYAS